MVFSSITFLFFFLPLSLLAGFAARTTPARNAALLVLSLLFYAWGEPVYVLLMVFSIAANYCLGLFVSVARPRARRAVLVAGVAANFAVLFRFKYAAFFLRLAMPVLSRLCLSPPALDVPLPVGISFYTFQIVSYLVDVSRDPLLVQKNPLSLGLYISFFPQLVAGPIVRYRDMGGQVRSRAVTFGGFCGGMERFVAGLGKKVLLANVFALYADTVLDAPPGSYSAVYAWLSMLAYSLQIFFDFSGYSDMAVGLGKLFGFDLPENFAWPYEAASITDFWRRWHISLSSWFREYLYIPLGGNRRGNARTCLNMFIVFLATGIWHGAAVNFAVWGAGHGALRVFERFLAGTSAARLFDAGAHPRLARAKAVAGRLYTLFSVYVLWIFFRNGTRDAVRLVRKMLGLSPVAGADLTVRLLYNGKAAVVFAVGILLCFRWWRPLRSARRVRLLSEKPAFSRCAAAAKCAFLLAVLVLSVSCLMSDSYNPFIYFRF